MSCAVFRRRNFITTLIVCLACFLCLSYLWQDGGIPLTRSDFIHFYPTEKTRNQSTSFLIQPKTGCSSVGVSDLHVVIIVVSKDSNTGQRLAIRQTWGNKDLQQKYGVRIYFLVGKGKNQDLGEENSIYGDIVQADIEEDYYKLSEKTIAVFQWVTEFCVNARNIFKCDDDIFLHIKRLLYIVKQPEFPNDRIVGRCLGLSSPYRSKSKWTVSYETYPFQYYPPHCTGPGYVMSMNTAKIMYITMKRTKIFALEDIFVGMIAYKLDISSDNINHFGYDYQNTTSYYYQQVMLYLYPECIVTQHRVAVEDLRNIWRKYSPYEDKPDPSYC